MSVLKGFFVFLTLFIQISLITMSSFKKSPISCMQKCTGPFAITNNFLEKPNIKYKEYKTELISYQDSITTGYANRRRWTSICYDGGFIDPNSKCSSNFHDMAPTIKEAKLWSSMKMCKIGQVCKPDGNCWGSDYEKCYDNTTETWVDSSKLEFVGSRYMFFPHHTCVSSWECAYKDLDFPVHVCSLDNPFPCIYNEDGSVMPTSLLVEGYRPKKDSLLFAIEDVGKPQKKLLTSKCYQTNDAFYCLLKVNGESIPIEIDITNKRGSYKNHLLVISEDIEILEDISRNMYFLSERPGAAASIEDLMILLAGLKVDMLANEANDATIIDFMNQVTNVINRMIQSLSKIDDLLIGNILGRDLSTFWRNKNVFELCNCSQRMDNDTNCKSGNIYYKGRVVQNNDVTHCQMHLDKPTDINFFKLSNMTFVDLQINSFETSSDFLDGWSWVMKNEISKMQDASSGNTNDRTFPTQYGGFGMTGLFSFDYLLYYFNIITNISFWIFIIIVRR